VAGTPVQALAGLGRRGCQAHTHRALLTTDAGLCLLLLMQVSACCFFDGLQSPPPHTHRALLAGHAGLCLLRLGNGAAQLFVTCCMCRMCSGAGVLAVTGPLLCRAALCGCPLATWPESITITRKVCPVVLQVKGLVVPKPQC
jgi:hypothetical protein